MRVVPLTDSPSAPPADHLFKLQLRERNDIRVIRDLMQRTGEPSAEVLRLDFDRRLMVQFRGSVVQDRKVFQLGKSDYGVMHNGRNRGLDKPEALSEHQARRREWDSIRGYHQGQRPYEPRRKAGHMTAPDRPSTNAHKNSCQTGASTYDNAFSPLVACLETRQCLRLGDDNHTFIEPVGGSGDHSCPI